MNLVILAIDNLVHADERAIEASNDLQKSFQETSNTIQNNLATINDYSARFNELSQGVSDTGENVSLTADEYNEYKDIVAGIVEIQPSLARGYSEENGYLVDKNTLLEEAIRLQREEALLAQEEAGSSDNLETLYEGTVAEYEQAVDDYDASRTDFISSFFDILSRNTEIEASDLEQVFSTFFNEDVSGQDLTWLLMDNYDEVISRFDELVSYLVSASLIGQDAANEMYAAWFPA